MNEAETEGGLIDPKLKQSGWGMVEGFQVLREYNVTAGKMPTGGAHTMPLIADYMLVDRWLPRMYRSARMFEGF